MILVNLFLKEFLSASLVAVSLSGLLGVHQFDPGQFLGAFRPVDFGHPVVGKPVGERARVVVAEDIDVRPVNEVIRQDTLIAALVQRTNNSDIGRIKLLETTIYISKYANGRRRNYSRKISTSVVQGCVLLPSLFHLLSD